MVNNELQYNNSKVKLNIEITQNVTLNKYYIYIGTVVIYKQSILTFGT